RLICFFILVPFLDRLMGFLGQHSNGGSIVNPGGTEQLGDDSSPRVSFYPITLKASIGGFVVPDLRSTPIIRPLPMFRQKSMS
ncbi:MAG: hypothetical protein KDL31_13260, partial [Kiritimatiellae bacterium]|nr:hypothetical protein [Kiritimatiellia bacterium]